MYIRQHSKIIVSILVVIAVIASFAVSSAKSRDSQVNSRRDLSRKDPKYVFMLSEME